MICKYVFPLLISIAGPSLAWSEGCGDNLKANDLFSPSFHTALVKYLGPIEVKTVDHLDESPKPKKSKEMTITAGGVLILQFYLWESEEGNGLKVEGIRAHNPLATDEASRRPRLYQVMRGLPGGELIQALKKMMELVKAQGYEFVETSGGSNYTVCSLYIRMMKMEPKNEKAAASLRTFERLYREASEDWPKDVRIRSYREFDKILDFPKMDTPYRALYKTYLETQTLPAGLRLIRNAAGKVSAVRFSDGRILLVDSERPDQPLVYWGGDSEYSIPLIKRLK